MSDARGAPLEVCSTPAHTRRRKLTRQQTSAGVAQTQTTSVRHRRCHLQSGEVSVFTRLLGTAGNSHKLGGNGTDYDLCVPSCQHRTEPKWRRPMPLDAANLQVQIPISTPGLRATRSRRLHDERRGCLLERAISRLPVPLSAG